MAAEFKKSLDKLKVPAPEQKVFEIVGKPKPILLGSRRPNRTDSGVDT
jgi:hypothetical protein